MSMEANKAAVRAYFERVLNDGALGGIDAVFANDIQFHYPLGELSGIDAVRDYLAAFLAAFPDRHFEVADLFGEGERIAARWTLTGSRTGALGGKAATGKPVSVPGNTIFHVSNGRIGEVWIRFDPALLL